MKDAPCGEFWASGTAPLDGMLYMVIANLADAFVTPAAAGLTVALHNITHPQVLCYADHGHRSRAFWCECKYIRSAGFLQSPAVRETPKLLW